MRTVDRMQGASLGLVRISCSSHRSTSRVVVSELRSPLNTKAVVSTHRISERKQKMEPAFTGHANPPPSSITQVPSANTELDHDELSNAFGGSMDTTASGPLYGLNS